MDMAFSESLEALREAISFGRRNQIGEAVSALANWLGAQGAWLFRYEGEKFELVGSFGETQKTPHSVFPEGDFANQCCWSLEGSEEFWLVKVPPDSTLPPYIFAVAMPEGKSPDQTALQISGELLASWLLGVKSEKGWEHLARAFRVATLGELAAGIAHEVNNPLQVIMGNAELLLDTAKLDNDVKQKLEDILAAADQIRKIARAITQFADARRTEEKELLDFGKVVQEASQLVAYSLVREGVKVNIELSSVPQIWGRRGDLEEIVVQLVRNAGEAIAESGKGSQVTVRVLSHGEKVRLEVEDDGPGIPPELKERIFDPFVTTKMAKGGTGLGLAIVQNLVTAHRGHIWLEDSPSGGAKFVVELPAWVATNQQKKEGSD